MTIQEANESIIKVLSPEVSNKIAAGEVVQRPASVVKELLDNAIDSGADRISVYIRQAGRTLIEVTDNGCGLSRKDVHLCFLRHATSKIHTARDLQHIQTLGFRGEALASIASISQVTMVTKRKEDDTATEYELHGGQEMKMEPAAAPDGTRVSVRNLFYNVPARRAFLKTDATEFRHILLCVQQASLAFPGIRFDLFDNGEPVYQLLPGDLSGRIADLFGASYKASLLPVEESTSLIKIRGYLSDPKLAKKNRGEQFFFINERPFFHRHLNYVIQNLYQDWIESSRYPFYALFFSMDSSKVDVNVHPAKLEVKFEDERSVSSLVRSVVKKALNSHMHVPLWQPGEELAGADSRSSIKKLERNLTRYTDPVPARSAEWLYDEGQAISRPEEPRLFDLENKVERQITGDRFWQIHHRFILSQTRNGLFIMDQHTAHKRILFEKVLHEAESGLPGTQQLLFPKSVDFSASDFSLLQELLPQINKMGFTVQVLSGNSVLILGVPSDIRQENEDDLLQSMLDQYKRLSQSEHFSQKERLALAMANKAAIPRGKKLSQPEMESLVDQLFACEEPYKDPLGKPTITSLTIDQITSLFRV